MSSAPIKVAVIGLSAHATAGWAPTAHLPYLLSPRGKEKYQIVALLNSSTKAAQDAISTYGLSRETHAYGDAEDLAKDPAVQLVVNVTRVDTHYSTILPSIKAGKDAFVEWPLADNIERVRELAALAKEHKIRTAVGIQGRLAPAFTTVSGVIRSGRIGKVLGSEVRGAGTGRGRDTVPAGIKWFTEWKFGGNFYTIPFAHVLDPLQTVLGEIHDPQVRFQIQHPHLKVSDPKSGEASETVTSDVPDLILLSGALPQSSFVEKDASIWLRLRRGPQFKGEPSLVWTVTGEKGELRVTSPNGPFLSAHHHDDDVRIELHDYKTDEVTPVPWRWEDYQLGVPLAGRSVAALYEAYATGDASRYPTFEDAARRHDQLEEFAEAAGWPSV